MKKIREFVHSYVFSDVIPLEARLLNITYLCGIVLAFVAGIIRYITGSGFYLLIVIMAIIFSVACLMYICNRFHWYRFCTRITIILICDILLPATYFFLGGAAGGSVAYFILAMVLIFLLSRGKNGVLFCITHILVVFACYYLNYRYPNLVSSPINQTDQQGLYLYLEHFQSFFIVGLCISAIIKFQNRIYLLEAQKESHSREEIVRQDNLLRSVNTAAFVLFAPDMERFEDSIQKGMEIMARSADVDRVFIWKSQEVDGGFYHKPIIQWANDPGLWVKETDGFFSSVKDAIIGRLINSPMAHLPQPTQDLFNAYGARSVLGVPIFIQNQFWGFVSFDDCHRDRYFSASEESVLQSGALLAANAVIRNDVTKSLIQAREEALTGTKAKSDFLARMSHEIRTPLNAILGFSEVELQKDLPTETQANISKVYHSGALLLEIVNNILDISKIESGNFEFIPAEYEPGRALNDAIQLNIMRIGSKPIEFKLELDETIPQKLFGDELRIKQILNNLLSNAFKYTDEGEVRLIVSWEQEGDRAWLTFTVKDTGRGIKKEDLEKLFSEYAQFEVAANRRIEGTGLGLSITRGLAERMGGSIDAESEHGKGSSFRVTLPQGIIDKEPIDRGMADALRNFHFIEDRNRNRGNTLIRAWMPYGKALAVDDLETNLDVMKGLLMPYGLQVDVVSSGREAVERIRAEEIRYDLVFMDHMMPEMDGIEAVRIIRNEIDSPYARQVPIVALTANAVEGNRELFLSSGFNDFISKPIDIKRLDMVLNQQIRDKQNAATLREAEIQARERAKIPGPESPGKFGDSKGDTESRWLLRHPIDGVDFAAAMKLYGNSGAAYLQILKSFVAHTPPLLEKMDIHLGSSLPDYAVEAHGLKGTCSAICAEKATDLARELEFASKEGKAELVGRKHGELRQMALELTDQLKTLLEEWESGLTPEAKERREEPERALLVRLSAAAGQFNSNATEEILGELERCRYDRGEELILWLRERAENFDYDAMHKRLEQFLS